MNDDEKEQKKWKTIKKNLNTENWVDFYEQYLLTVAKANTDVETLVITGKEPKWKIPTMDDRRPLINIDTGLVVMDNHNVPSTEKVYKNTDEGKEDFKFDKNAMRKRIQAYKNDIKPCMVVLIQHVEDSLLRVMRIDKEKYTTIYDENDIVKLVALARFAATGQGADSIYGDLIKMSIIKVENGDWVKFTYTFQELRKRILNSNVNKADMLEKFFDALFIIRSGEGVRPLEKLVSEIMCLKEWPTADKCMAVWNTMLTTKKNLDTRFESERKEGALSANMTTLQQQVKNLQDQVTSYGNPSVELKAHYTKSAPGESSGIICHNCGKRGHGRRRCRAPLSICKECGENHITSQHSAVLKVQRRDTGSTAVDRKVPEVRLAHVAEVEYEDDPDDTEDRQDEDERIVYQGRLSNFEPMDNTAGSYCGVKLSNFNVTICKDGVGIGVEEPLDITIEGSNTGGNTRLRDVVINEMEYHYLSDDDDEVIETIIPEYTKNVKILETVVSDVNHCHNRDTCEVKHDRSEEISCSTVNKIVRPKRPPPSRPIGPSN